MGFYGLDCVCGLGKLCGWCPLQSLCEWPPPTSINYAFSTYIKIVKNFGEFVETFLCLPLSVMFFLLSLFVWNS